MSKITIMTNHDKTEEMNYEALRQAAKDIVAAIRKQNWKNGGVLEMDIDVAEGMVENALYRARCAGEAREKERLIPHQTPQEVESNSEWEEDIRTTISLGTYNHIVDGYVQLSVSDVEKVIKIAKEAITSHTERIREDMLKDLELYSTQHPDSTVNDYLLDYSYNRTPLTNKKDI